MNPLTAPSTFPETLEASEIRKDMDSRGLTGYHESVLRSRQMLILIKDLLRRRVDHEVIEWIIALNYPE